MYKMAQKDTNFPLVKANLPEKGEANSTVALFLGYERETGIRNVGTLAEACRSWEWMIDEGEGQGRAHAHTHTRTHG
ncbi:hypothetical protein SRHO_G00127010 [Serrasalmus rhombeus]